MVKDQFRQHCAVDCASRDLKIDVYGKRQTADDIFDFTSLL